MTVEPFAGETVRSLYRRLAERNAIPSGELWTAIRHAQLKLPLKTTPEAAPHLVEQLAGLPPGHLDGRPQDRLFVRCAHAAWQYNPCPICAPLPAPATMCRRCTRGQTVEVRTRSGAVCARHHRWHYASADDDLTGQNAHLHAERFLTGTLWQRGLALNTGELELATELLGFRHTAGPQHAQPGILDGRFREYYPKAVQVTALLTEPWAERFLTNIRLGRLPVAVLVAAVVTAVDTHSRHQLATLRESFRAYDRETLITLDRTVRLRHGRSPGLDEFGTKILAIASRVRGTFLRHADARRPPTHHEHAESSRAS
ncbi:hypothetical protein [Microbacterium sp.]|uniref:hypothetical protein n=1 Tax=Microbacterium sp. TaxID=51671 RepID=UPI003C7434CE